MDAIVLEVNFNERNTVKNIANLQKSLDLNKSTLKELKAQYEANNISQDDFLEGQAELRAESKRLRKEQNEYIKQLNLAKRAEEASNGSRQQLVAQLALAQKELSAQKGLLKQNEDGTIELSEAYEKASSQVLNAKEALIEFDQGIKDGRTNVGNYKDAITEAFESQSLFGVSTENITNLFSGGLKDGVKQATTAFNGLKAAIAANPILALAAVLAALVTAFASTEKGANRLQQIFARVQNVLDEFLSVAVDVGGTIVEAFAPIVDVVAVILEATLPLVQVIGEGLKIAIQVVAEPLKVVSIAVEILGAIVREVTTTLTEFGSYLTDGLASAFSFLEAPLGGLADGFEVVAEGLGLLDRSAEERTKRLQDLNTALIKQEAINADLLRQAEQQRRDRDDEFRSIEDRIKSNTELGRIEEERVKQALALEREKLKLLEEELAKTPQNLRNTEQLQEVEEQRTKIAEILEDSLGKQTEQITNQVSLARELLEGQKALNEIALQRDILQGKIIEGSKDELEARKNLIDLQLEQDLQGFIQRNKGLEKLYKEDREAALQQLAQTNTQAKVLIEQRGIDILQLNKDFTDSQADAYQSYLDEIDKANQEQATKDKARLDNQLQEDLARLQLRVLRSEEGSEEQLNARIALLKRQGDEEVKQFEENSNQAKLVLERVEQEELALRNEFNQKQLEDEQLLSDSLEQTILDSANSRLTALQLQLDEELNINQRRLDNQISQEKFANEELLNEKKRALDEQRALEVEFSQAQLDFDLSFKDLSDQEIQAAELRNKERLLDIETRYADAKVGIDRVLQDSEEAKLQAQAQIFGDLAGFFEEGTAAYKVFATGEALISSYLAYARALALPLPPPLPQIQAGIVLAQGLANVARIQGLEFAEGGIVELARGGRVRGPGSGTSDSITANVSNGEAVLVARAMSSADTLTATGTPREIASSINSRYGGVSFQSGGIVSTLSPQAFNTGSSSSDAFTAAEAITEASSDQEIFLSLTDFRDEDKKLSITERRANSG